MQQQAKFFVVLQHVSCRMETMFSTFHLVLFVLSANLLEKLLTYFDKNNCCEEAWTIDQILKFLQTVAYLGGGPRCDAPLWPDHENFLQATLYEKVRCLLYTSDAADE